MVKNRIALFLIAPFFIFLTACGATSGTVVDKTHTESYYLTTWYSCGKTICPMLQYIPPSWSVIIKQDSDGTTKASDVSETIYNSCLLGMHWQRTTTDDDGYCK